MNKTIQEIEEEFGLQEDLVIEEIKSPIPFFLPFADHDLAFDTVENDSSSNIQLVQNTYPSNRFSTIYSFSPIDSEKESYILVLSVSHTVETYGKMFKIEWE